MSKEWKLMKLAFEYFSLGFQRIIFMVLGAQIAFILCYLLWVNILVTVTIPALPVPYATGGQTLAAAMILAGVAAIAETIEILLFFAALAMVIGYFRFYFSVLSYYDEEKYSGYRMFRGAPVPKWLQSFSIGKHAEQERLNAVEDCKKRCNEIRYSFD